MSPDRRIALIAGAAMLSSAALSDAATPSRKLSELLPSFDLEVDVPREFGQWSVDRRIVPILPSPDVLTTIDKIYDQTIGRTYVDEAGGRVMLSIAYGSAQTRKLRAHRQEVCYSAQGFQISGVKRERVAILGVPIPITKMVATQGNRIEPVLYWFTMGHKAVMSLWDRQLAQFDYSLRGLIPDGFLVRFSSIDPNREQAYSLQLKFASDLVSALKPDLAARLLGDGRVQ